MSLTSIILDMYRILLGGIGSQLVIAVVIILIGFIFGKICGRGIKKILSEIDFDKHIKKVGFKQKLASTISTSVSYVIYFSAIVIALRQFTIIGPVFYSMLAVVVVVLVFSATLTARDFFPNFYAGFALKRKGIAKEGSHLKVQNASGIVEKISWTKTKIKTESGDTIFISNEQILKSKNSRK